MRYKWTNWQLYQSLTTNMFQQVDYNLSKVILKCGFSWSPAMGSQPILLTALRNDPDMETLNKLGFELEKDIVQEPSMENGFDYKGYLSSAWSALGVNPDQKESQPPAKNETESGTNNYQD